MKATNNSETVKISYDINVKNLIYYENCHLPVIILYWIKTSNEFYCLLAQKYIKEIIGANNPDWKKQKTISLEFGDESKLVDINVLNSLATEGNLHIVKNQLRENPQFWLNGIPESNNDKLKELMLKAFNFLKREEYLDAISAFENILKTCTIISTQRMSILICLGNAYLSVARYDEAEKNYEAVIDISKNSDNKDYFEALTNAKGNIGLIRRIRNDFDSALKIFNEVLENFKKLNNNIGIAAALTNIGSIYLDKCDFKNSEKYSMKALEINQRIGFKKGEASNLQNIGHIHQKSSKNKLASEYFQKALNIFRENNLSSGESRVLSSIGFNCFEEGDSSKALEYLKEALEIQQKNSLIKEEADTLGNISLIYKNIGKIDLALQNMQKVLAIHEKIQNKKGIATSLNNIGLIYYELKNYDLALTNTQNGLDMHKKIGCKHGEADAYSVLSLVYKAKGNIDLARDNAEAALKIHSSLGIKKWEADDLRILGYLFFDIKDYSTSLKYFQKALSIYDIYKIFNYRDLVLNEINKIKKMNEIDK